MRMDQILRVAENEFTVMARNQIIPVFSVILLAICIFNAIGCYVHLPKLVTDMQSPLYVFMYTGIQGNLVITAILFYILSMCLGIFSIADERSKGTLRVLNCKPLYRADVIIGKFAGSCGFLLLTIVLTLSLMVSLTLIMYQAPMSALSEVVPRIVSYMLLLFLSCATMLGLTMLVTIPFSTDMALAISVSMIFVQWFVPAPRFLGSLDMLEPAILYIYAISPPSSGRTVFNVLMPLSDYLIGSLPYILFMILEVILVLMVCCSLYNYMENLKN